MDISYTKQIPIFLLLLLLGSISYSQSDFESLGETSFALNHKTGNSYNMNFAVRSRYYVFQNEDLFFKNRQIDLVHFSTYNIDFNHSISFGIQYRFREIFDDFSNELRLSQQFNYKKKSYVIRFGHRVRLEQRLFNNLTIIRYRYRFALDFPLNGEKLDVGEVYFIGAMEALLSQSSKLKPELDHRTTLHLGWLLSQQLKLQIGAEYRFEAFNIETEQRLFILTSAILNI